MAFQSLSGNGWRKKVGEPKRRNHIMIKSIFHININVKDFDRSLAFYQKLGFR